MMLALLVGFVAVVFVVVVLAVLGAALQRVVPSAYVMPTLLGVYGGTSLLTLAGLSPLAPRDVVAVVLGAAASSVPLAAYAVLQRQRVSVEFEDAEDGVTMLRPPPMPLPLDEASERIGALDLPGLLAMRLMLDEAGEQEMRGELDGFVRKWTLRGRCPCPDCVLTRARDSPPRGPGGESDNGT